MVDITTFPIAQNCSSGVIMPTRRILTALVVLVLLSGAGLVAWMLHAARVDPVVRRATLALPNWPAGAAPVRVALISDIHLGSRAMDSPRLRRIVALTMARRPDLVVIAGDFVAGHEPADAGVLRGRLGAALAGLRPRLGTVAVLGNHDHLSDPAIVRAELARVGITVLDNRAVRRGPLALGGIDDVDTRQGDLPATLASMRALPGARVLLTHSPDIAPRLPADVTLALAGHSHCGQVVLPLVGAPVLPLETGDRYRCGIITEELRRVVVTAGLGTSMMPLRLGAPPDLWLLTLGPAATAETWISPCGWPRTGTRRAPRPGRSNRP